MSLSLALTNTISALKVNQDALSVITQNITNANSENYTRRTITLEPSVVAGQVAGAEVSAVTRVVDQFLANSARRQAPAVGKADVKVQYFDRLQLALGEPGANNSLNSYLDDFFASLSDLAANTEQNYLRSSAVSSGVTLATKVSDLGNYVETTRYEVDREISQTVDEINSTLQTLESLNKRIANAEIQGSDKNALYDQRDALLQKLSTLIDADQSINGDGTVTIFLARGELLNPNNRFHLDYKPAAGPASMINDDILNAITVTMVDADTGELTDSSYTLVSASNDPKQVNNFTSGRLKGLLELRDIDLPKVTDTLDNLARNITDAFNAVQNDGVGFPPASTLTGTRQVTLDEERFYSGKMMIAVLDKATGEPVTNPYYNVTADKGINPLVIDFDRLNSGQTGEAGIATVRDVITEINEYFGAGAANRFDLSNLQDIKLVGVSDNITSAEATGTLTFPTNPVPGDSITLNGTTYNFIANGTPSFGTNIEIQTNTSLTLQEVIRYLKTISSSPTSDVKYTSIGNSLTITHKTSGTGGNAYTIDASAAGVTYSGGGLPNTLQGGANPSGISEFDLEFLNVLPTTQQVRILSASIDGGAAGVTTVLPAGFGPIDAESGVRQRTSWDQTTNGKLQIDFTGSTLQEGQLHNVTMQIEVTDPQTGVISTETVVFQVPIPDPTLGNKNLRYDAVSISGVENGTLTPLQNNNFFIRAELVDATGKVIPPEDTTTPGVMRLRTSDGTLYGIGISELNGKESGSTTVVPGTVTATGFGVSHFFGLNDFFTTGSTEVRNSAVNFKVRDDYRTDTSRISSARLAKSAETPDPNDEPVYTYEIGRGSNQAVTALANVRFANISFSAAGGIPKTTMNLNNYAAEIITYTSGEGATAKQHYDEEKLIFDGFNDRMKATGGVNLDEELANTVIFQNNYAAAARMVNVISDLFEKLTNAF